MKPTNNKLAENASWHQQLFQNFKLSRLEDFDLGLGDFEGFDLGLGDFEGFDLGLEDFEGFDDPAI